MRTTFKKSLLLTSIQTAAVCAATSFLPTTGLAEAAQEKRNAPADKDASEDNRASAINVEFPGGTLLELSKVLTSVQGDVSITVPKEIENSTIGGLSLKNIQFEDLNGYINSATRKRKTEIVFLEKSPNHWTFEGYDNEPHELAIFPVENVLRKNSVDDVLAVVGEAYSIAGIENVPHFHLHKETSILMAWLTKQELGIVERIIAALETPVADSAEDLEKKQDIARDEVKRMQLQLFDLSIRVAEKIDEAAAVDADKKPDYEARIQMMTSEQRLLENEIASYEHLLSRLRAAELGLGDDFQLNPVTPTSRGRDLR